MQAAGFHSPQRRLSGSRFVIARPFLLYGRDQATSRMGAQALIIKKLESFTMTKCLFLGET
jgi:hypothetical protein